jgi:MFS family permease
MKHLALIATAVSCMGGFFFGYDTGVISGVLTMPTFPTYFGIAGDPTNIAQTKGDVVSLLQAGCCVGALLINLLADPIGRKWSIVFSSLVFLMGSVMQVAAKNLATMMAGRFFGGCKYLYFFFWNNKKLKSVFPLVGVGACSMLVPLYIAEIAPPKLRGRLGTVYQFFNVAGIMCSYWIDYACIHNLPVGDEQWRIPLAIQLIPGGLLCIGMSLSPESLRWLSIKGKDETLQKTLVALRDLPEDHPEIIEELHEIHAAAELEKQNKQSKWTELFQPANFHRVLIAIAMQSFQQWTGTNAIVSIFFFYQSVQSLIFTLYL